MPNTNKLVGSKKDVDSTTVNAPDSEVPNLEVPIAKSPPSSTKVEQPISQASDKLVDIVESDVSLPKKNSVDVEKLFSLEEDDDPFEEELLESLNNKPIVVSPEMKNLQAFLMENKLENLKMDSISAVDCGRILSIVSELKDIKLLTPSIIKILCENPAQSEGVLESLYTLKRANLYNKECIELLFNRSVTEFDKVVTVFSESFANVINLRPRIYKTAEDYQEQALNVLLKDLDNGIHIGSAVRALDRLKAANLQNFEWLKDNPTQARALHETIILTEVSLSSYSKSRALWDSLVNDSDSLLVSLLKQKNIPEFNANLNTVLEKLIFEKENKTAKPTAEFLTLVMKKLLTEKPVELKNEINKAPSVARQGFFSKTGSAQISEKASIKNQDSNKADVSENIESNRSTRSNR